MKNQSKVRYRTFQLRPGLRAGWRTARPRAPKQARRPAPAFVRLTLTCISEAAARAGLFPIVSCPTSDAAAVASVQVLILYRLSFVGAAGELAHRRSARAHLSKDFSGSRVCSQRDPSEKTEVARPESRRRKMNNKRHIK